MWDAWIYALLGVGLGLTLQALLRMRRRRAADTAAAAQLRRSLLESALDRQREQRERWRQISLNRLHPLNRREVERLLELVRAAGVTALTDRERLFLDHLSDTFA